MRLSLGVFFCVCVCARDHEGRGKLPSTEVAAHDERESGSQRVCTEKDFDMKVYNTSATFANVLHLIKEKHYRIPEEFEECMYGALDTLLSTIDPHSGFLAPKSYKNILTTMNGEFCGIGVVIDTTRQTKDPTLAIVDTIANGPAEKAGVRPFDKIVEIDGHVVEGMSTEEATARLRGKPATTVVVKVIRDQKISKGDMLTFTIKRDIIKEQNSRCFLLNDQNMCYVAFNIFTETSVGQLEKLISEANKKKYKGIILDLRNNSGGLLLAAVDIAGLFVDKGSLVVVTKDRDGHEIERHVTKHRPIACATPFIVILINNYTASAAEILAGCLTLDSNMRTNPDKPIVILIGEKTFGKGSVQEIIPLCNECAAKITTSLYYLADGTSLQARGIEPDVAVDRTCQLPEQVAWFNANYGRECALANHIKPLDYTSATEHERVQKNTARAGGRDDGGNVVKADVHKDGDKDTQAPEGAKESSENEVKGFLVRSKEMLATDNQFLSAITVVNMLTTVRDLAPKKINCRRAAVEFLKDNYRTHEKIELTELKI